MGGAQSLHVDSFDEAYSAPTETSALVSLRTQQIIQVETGVTKVVDPLGGSYYVEYLTSELERRIFEFLEKVKSLGGIVRAVETGWIHRLIADFAYRQQRAIESGELPIVGVNYLSSEKKEPPMEIFRYPETESRQRAKLKELREKRDKVRWKEALDRVRECCHEGSNLMPVVMDAVRARATLGEIQQIFRECFGLWEFPLK